LAQAPDVGAFLFVAPQSEKLAGVGSSGLSCFRHLFLANGCWSVSKAPGDLVGTDCSSPGPHYWGGPQKYFLKFVQERQKKRPVFEAVEGKNGAEYGVAGDGCSKILKSARISDLFWLRLLLLSSNLRPFSPKMKTNLTSF